MDAALEVETFDIALRMGEWKRPPERLFQQTASGGVLRIGYLLRNAGLPREPAVLSSGALPNQAAVAGKKHACRPTLCTTAG